MSKIIKILGTGCPSCVRTEKIVEEAVKELNIDAKIIKVTEILDIMMYDVMKTPAVVIDDKVVIKGKVPSKEDVKAYLVDNFASNACCSDENTASSCCSDDSNNTNCC